MEYYDMTQPVTQPVNLIHTLLISPWNQNDHHCIRYSICWMPVAESNYETTNPHFKSWKIIQTNIWQVASHFFCLRRFFFFSAFGQLPGCWGNLNNPSRSDEIWWTSRFFFVQLGPFLPTVTEIYCLKSAAFSLSPSSILIFCGTWW